MANKKFGRINIFVLLFIFWIVISVFNVFYNSFKFISEAKHLLPLSAEQKRYEVYGNFYKFIEFIGQNTPQNSSILINSKDDKAYYLGRYYLYPRFVSVFGIKYTFDTKKGITDFIATDDFISTPSNYFVTASKSGYIIFKHK